MIRHLIQTFPQKSNNIRTPFHSKYLSSYTGDVNYELSRNSLLKCGFSAKETDIVLTSLKPFISRESPQLIKSSFDCIRTKIRPKSVEFQKNHQRLVDIFLNKESKLLLLGEDFILSRITQLKSLDCIRSSNDLWHVLQRAPFGYFLQDWTLFLQKYYYVTFKILPWLEPKPIGMNPIAKFPEVIEQDYIVIKSRNIFVQRVGSPFLNSQKSKDINLFTLIMFEPKNFLKIYAPNCSEEELKAMYYLSENEVGEEDDELFESLAELAPKSGDKIEFVKNNISENYVLSNIR